MTSLSKPAFFNRAERRLNSFIEKRRQAHAVSEQSKSDVLAPWSIDEHTLRDIGIEQGVAFTEKRISA